MLLEGAMQARLFGPSELLDAAATALRGLVASAPASEGMTYTAYNYI